MKFNCILLFIFYSTSGIAQGNIAAGSKTKINFCSDMNWEQIKQKAKLENKFIFVDAFTTWCGPCKEMELTTYTNDSVGNLTNSSFVSIKLQMDSTPRDADSIKRWYNVAHQFQQMYGITGYPTFLFFSPEGDVVHKDIGYKDAPGFLMLLADALDTNKQYYTLLNKLKQNSISRTEMPTLANELLNFDDSKSAIAVARKYITKYLETPNDQLYSIKDLIFFKTYYKAIKLNDNIVTVLRSSPKTIDSIAGQEGFSLRMMINILGHEIIDSATQSAKAKKEDANWRAIYTTINDRFGNRNAKFAILAAKPGYYYDLKQWKEYTKSLVLYINTFGYTSENISFEALYLNNNAWDIFSYSDAKAELTTALSWSQEAVRLEPSPIIKSNYLDTKANLLYKLGRVKEAISVEGSAQLLDPGNESTKENLTKMKRHLPTW